MKGKIEKLGKVSITVEKDYWDKNKAYNRLTIVERQGTSTAYLSRKAVPIGIDITDRNYWITISKWADIPYEIVQEFGDSPELVISQKVVTLKVNELQELIDNINDIIGEGSIDERIAEEGAKHYTKEETYSKTELNNLITTPDQQYVSVASYQDLPDIGSADTIYRVGGTTSYSEYGWNGTDFVLLSEKNVGIDDELTAGSDNLVKSGGIFSSIVDSTTYEITDLNIKNYGINATGKFGTNATYSHACIPVHEGDIYYLIGSSGYYALATTDAFEPGGDIPMVEGTSVVRITTSVYSKVIIPQGCSYLLFAAEGIYPTRCFKKITITDDFDLKQGDALSSKAVTNGLIPVKESILGKNLYANKWDDDRLLNKYIDVNGQLSNSNSTFVSEKIAVQPVYKYLTISLVNGSTLQSSRQWRFLDASDNLVIHGKYNNNKFQIIEIPQNAAYFQFTADNSLIGSIVVEYGCVPSLMFRQVYFSNNEMADNIINIKRAVSDIDYTNENTWTNWWIDDSNKWLNTSQRIDYKRWSIIIPIIQKGIMRIINNDAVVGITVKQLNILNTTNNVYADITSETSSITIAHDTYEDINVLGNYIYIYIGRKNVDGSDIGQNCVSIAPSIMYNGINLMKHYGEKSLQEFAGSIEQSDSFIKHYNIGNLFDRESDDIIIKKYIAPLTGVLTNTGYDINTSPLIPVNNNDVICFSYQTEKDITEKITRGWRFLDSDGQTILSYGGNVAAKNFLIPVPTINGSKPTYFQISYTGINQEYVVLTYGSAVPGSYLYFGNQQKGINIAIDKIGGYDFILPDTLLFAKNKNVGIYFNTLTHRFVENAPKFVTFGSNIPVDNRTDKALYTHTNSEAGDATINAITYSENGEYFKELTRRIIDGSSFSGDTVNILAIGDSYTAIGKYLDRINAHAQEDGIDINWIGLMNTRDAHLHSENQTGGQLRPAFMEKRMGTNSEGAFCQGTTFKIAVSGLVIKEFNINYGLYTSYKDTNNVTWWITGYKIDANGNGYLRVTSTSETAQIPTSGVLTKSNTMVGDATISYNGADAVNRNPLWDEVNQTYSFSYYINKWGFASPDILLFMFWNGLSDAWSKQTLVDWVNNDFTPFVEKFHAQYPSAKVIYSLPPFGRTINSYSDVNGVKYSRQYLFEVLYDLYKDSSYVQICPSYIFVDNENGFDGTNTVVNSLYPDYQPSVPNQSQFVHPNDGGMCEIGNAVYPYILNAMPI